MSYDVNAANTNRIVRFRVEPTAAADRSAALFGMLQGRAPAYPHYGKLATTPTANQTLAQLRTSYVVRALTRYAIPVGVALVADSAATAGATANFGPALMLTFETDERGEFFNNAWTGNTTLSKHSTAAITDTVGVGGMTTVKTKLGLQGLLDSLYNVSFDGGTTGLFGMLSASGAIVLPNGATTAGAPPLDSDGAAGVTAGLTVTFVA